LTCGIHTKFEIIYRTLTFNPQIYNGFFSIFCVSRMCVRFWRTESVCERIFSSAPEFFGWSGRKHESGIGKSRKKFLKFGVITTTVVFSNLFCSILEKALCTLWNRL
jgi:hypothetical protein